MELRQLILAIQLSETLHFGRTAELRGMSQSTLSHQISKLEEELGFRIFERQNRSVRLSVAGETFIAQARDIVSRFARSVEEGRLLAGESRQALRVGLFGEAAGELTHEFFMSFRAQFPDFRLIIRDLRTTNQVDSLIGMQVDVALLRLPIFDKRLEILPLFDEPRVAVLPAWHEKALKDELSSSELAGEPFLQFGDAAPPEWNAFWNLEETLSSKASATPTAETPSEVLNAVAYSGAVDTVPLSSSRVFHHPGVRFVKLADASRSTLALVSLKDHSPPKVRAFRKCVITTVQQNISLVSEARLLLDT